ncbi:MAG TPA: tetratricopeptide repeat protein, partial [Gammaproteobacteria bacterium]|nr:tetratricopeptide repeat protein [Gammaproteobacteria bacterium]
MRLVVLALVGLIMSPLAAEETISTDARALLEAGRFSEAAAAARSEIAASPQAAESWHILADALAATGENEQALAAYQQIPPGPEGPRLDVE